MVGRMRWTTDLSGRWELDMESPATMEGAARPVPLDPPPLLGISRGTRVTRTKQLDFMHRFMSSPFVPSLSAFNGGFFLDHAHLAHLTERWSVTLLEKLDMQKLVSFIRESLSKQKGESSWPKFIANRMSEILTFGVGTEFLITPGTTLLVETYNINKGNRSKAIFHHKLAKHNVTFEAAWPGRFVDKTGTYWDVPVSLALDLASVGSDSGLSYHLCLHHLNGEPKIMNANDNKINKDKVQVPVSLLPGLCAKTVLSFKKSVDFWRKREGKVKMVQPYDLFLSEPHVSGSATLGAVAGASISENSRRIPNSFKLFKLTNKVGLFGDLFASVSVTAQHGNFQRLLLDLTRLTARLDINSGSIFLDSSTRLVNDWCNSRSVDLEVVRAVCPELFVSLQQQLVGPFSFRVDSKIIIDPRNKNKIGNVDESVFAIDWALKVLGSAKATAWYAPSRQEGMIELRFFET